MGNVSMAMALVLPRHVCSTCEEAASHLLPVASLKRFSVQHLTISNTRPTFAKTSIMECLPDSLSSLERWIESRIKDSCVPSWPPLDLLLTQLQNDRDRCERICVLVLFNATCRPC